MISVEDALPDNVKYKLGWPLKSDKSPLVAVYKNLRATLFKGELTLNSSHFGRLRFPYSVESTKGMVISCGNESVLKALSSKQHIYLTPARFFMRDLYSCPTEYEYVAILKKEGRIGYCVLIIGFDRADYSFRGSHYEEYGRHFGLMEVFSDGTTVLFERCLPWDIIKSCRANTTSIRDLFFNPDERSSIQAIVDHAIRNQCSDNNEIYSYSIGEDLSKRLFECDDIPW